MNEQECRDIALARATVGGVTRCERCGAYGLLTLHHRRKRSHLPRIRYWEPSNCVMLCGDGVRGCHGWVENHPQLAAGEGFHVWAHQEPGEVLVTLWHHPRPVRLDDEGGIWDRLPYG